ncbi:MAG: Rieske 2Fe-2S domain-containing protein, partial [Burkholderiales bacterium]
MTIASPSHSASTHPAIAFPKNAWYVAAYPEDIGNEMFARTILGEHLVFYRPKDGQLVALQDRCPHRLAPLSRGQLIDDCIECPYHGLRFASDGRCSFNPHHPGTIPVKMKVPTFPVVERHGLVWIWMGDVTRADAAHIPDLAYLT